MKNPWVVMLLSLSAEDLCLALFFERKAVELFTLMPGPTKSAVEELHRCLWDQRTCLP